MKRIAKAIGWLAVYAVLELGEQALDIVLDALPQRRGDWR